ncbi:MAG: hypothetical protein KC413_02735 [Anaerolineales bacterium]|nr:hypothetical protein [Anaerolineales bacterium]
MMIKKNVIISLALMMFVLISCLDSVSDELETEEINSLSPVVTPTKSFVTMESSPIPQMSAYPYPVATTEPPAYPGPKPVFRTPTPVILIPTCESPNVVMGEEFDTAVALHILYGNLGCVHDEKQEVQIIENGKLKGILLPLVIGDYVENGFEKVIFLTEARLYGDCHPCPAVIGGAVFVKENDQWFVAVQNDHIVEMGSFGIAPSGELTRLGKDKFGILFTSKYTSTGTSSEGVQIISDIDGVLQYMGGVPTAAADVHMESWAYTATFTFVPEDDLVFDDIQVTIAGTKWISYSIQSFQETVVYTVKHDRYSLQD